MQQLKVFVVGSGNTASMRVLLATAGRNVGEEQQVLSNILIMPEGESLRRFLSEAGYMAEEAVVLFDECNGRKFRYYDLRKHTPVSAPRWLAGSGIRWAVGVSTSVTARSCALQIRASFIKYFAERIGSGEMPWGLARTSKKKHRLRYRSSRSSRANDRYGRMLSI